jgi:hypothetical protein
MSKNITYRVDVTRYDNNRRDEKFGYSFLLLPNELDLVKGLFKLPKILLNAIEAYEESKKDETT